MKWITINPVSRFPWLEENGSGLYLITLFRFLKEEKEVDFIRLTKIEQWIEKNEK